MESTSRTHRNKKNKNKSVNTSPEFEFWNNTNYNNPDSLFTPLHSADELFSHGFLLPLHFLPNPRPEPEFVHEPEYINEQDSEIRNENEPSALITSDNPILSVSKRWKELFKRTEKKLTNNDNNNDSDGIKPEKMKKRRVKKDRKTGNGPGSAELNINIWPFTRSRSAGNNSNRSSKSAKSTRKVSSAPCSRSNSSGESKLLRRTCPASPGRAGIHLARASPVWRAGPPQRRQYSSCRGDEVVRGGGSGGVRSGGNGNLFGFRGLFSKKCTVLSA